MTHFPSDCRVCSTDGDSQLNTRLCLDDQNYCVQGNVTEEDWNAFGEFYRQQTDHEDTDKEFGEWDEEKAGWCGNEAGDKQSVQHCVAAKGNVRYCAVCTKKHEQNCENGKKCVAIGDWDEKWYDWTKLNESDASDRQDNFPLITELGFCAKEEDDSSANGCLGFKPKSAENPSPHDTTVSPPANPDAADNLTSASSTLCPSFIIGLLIGAVMLFV